MDSSRKLKALVPICLICLIAVAFAEDENKDKKAELEKTLGESGSLIESTTSMDEVTFPEDTTPRFTVKELQISGNDLISTTELLEKLPVAYIVSITKDEEPVKEIYDFRVLQELVRDPGRDYEVSLKTIQGLTKYILSAYQEKGYAGIYVYVPAEAVKQESKLADEILPIQVLEGKIAQISVERYDFDRKRQESGFLKSPVLESWSPVKEGDVIHKKKLDDFVRLLNLNPDRYISPVISRGTEPNSLNLSYDVYETSPWHWYVQVDNSGTKDRQWSPRVGVINTNLLGMDDRFSVMYQAPWEKGIEEEYAVFGSYDVPVFIPRLRLNIYSGYSQFDIPEAGINFLGNGSFYGSVLSYNLLQIDDWFFDLTSSLSFERSKVTPSLGIASDVDMELWGVGANIHRSDDMSNSSLRFNRSESMGGSSRRRFEDARLGADPDFAIYNFAATHSHYLDSTKVNRISGSFRFVTSDERLVPAKMTTFGGLYSVRGYEEDEIVADGGILVSGQYEFDLVEHSKVKQNQQDSAVQEEDNKSLIRKLAPLAFVDFGRAKIEDPVVGEKEVHELCSVGTGIIIETENNFSAGIYYGWPLRGTDETDRGDGRLNASFMLRF
ncbi:MAG: ShlB/FhaC/HecB family hemolysin secretion/activation protein [Planctomycetota bacterium]